jgi:hypothetical protein
VTTVPITVTWVEVSPDRKTITQTWDSGMAVVSSTHGYTESHLVHVVAYDAAGNKTESEKVRFYIIHKPKEKKKGEDVWRREELLAVATGSFRYTSITTGRIIGRRRVWA